MTCRGKCRAMMQCSSSNEEDVVDIMSAYVNQI